MTSRELVKRFAKKWVSWSEAYEDRIRQGSPKAMRVVARKIRDVFKAKLKIAIMKSGLTPEQIDELLVP